MFTVICTMAEEPSIKHPHPVTFVEHENAHHLRTDAYKLSNNHSVCIILSL